MSHKERSIATRVVEAVARTSGADALALPPLQQTIEAEALDALYAHASAAGEERTTPTVLFSYAGCRVCVNSATDIEVRAQSAESASPTET